MTRFLSTFFLLVASALMAHGQLVINELMQSNIDCVMDDLNEFPDSWVELYNTSDVAVNLKDYKLGETDNAGDAWQLPDKMVGPKQMILVYCDKEASGMHTPFRLESGKGMEVWLFKNTEVVDKVTGLKKQPAPNIAFGRKTDGADDWGYQETPTPGKTNCGIICKEKDILGEPEFSEKGRVMTSSGSISLTLSLPEGTPEGTVIRYTTNGSEPTEESAQYQSPITISRTTTVRAKLFCSGYLSPRSTTHSYIYFPTNRPLTLPVISIVTDSKYLNDPKIGIYVEGSYQSGKKNFEFDWRRPINFEYFEGADQKSQLNQLCETRIQGGATRTNKRKSLAVYANKRFGEKRLKYEFFPDQRPGVTDFKSVVLRNSGNDFDYLYMRDAVIQRTMASHVDLDWQAWRPAIIYINGEYTGMLNIRERSNEDNIYTNYDGLEDLDMIENWWDLKEGDWDNYNRFKAFYTEHGHTMAEYEKWMDCYEFINLMLMNLYYCNLDFPGNNIVMWRPRTDSGRWRWIAKDTDFGLGLYDRDVNYNTIQWINDHNYDPANAWANDWDHTRLFRRLMEDNDFKREFLDRAVIYMGDFMNYKGTHEVWDPMYEMIRTEYPYHRELINKWWPNYNDEVNKINNWLSKRTDIFMRHLSDYYNNKVQPVELKINKSLTGQEQSETQLELNGVQLSSGIYDGKFYPDHDIVLSATAPEGKAVTGWKIVQVNANGNTLQSTSEGETIKMKMPNCQTLSINAIFGNANGIDNVSERTKLSWRTSGNQLLLSGIGKGQRVSLYNLQGVLVGQQTANGCDICFRLPSGSQAYVLRVGGKTVKIK